MTYLILFLSLVYSGLSLASDLPICPYPLPQDVEPCICEVDEEYRLLLKCELPDTFSEESFNKVTNAFDYNNEIYNFSINLYDSTGTFNFGTFLPQLNGNNLGKLNVTNFSLKNAWILDNHDTFILDGAFDGSAGSIKNIHIQNIITRYDIFDLIDLGSNVLDPAGPTLETLKLEEFDLSQLKLSNMMKIEYIDLSTIEELAKISLDNLPSLTNLSLSQLDDTETIVDIENCQNLNSLDLTNSTVVNLDIANCQNLNSLDLTNSNVVNLHLVNVDAMETLTLYDNPSLNHVGLGSSLHAIKYSGAEIFLGNTNVRTLDEFVFRPLLETLASDSSSSGFIDLAEVNLDCGCDVKWIMDDFYLQLDFFRNARCTDGSSLQDVDPNFLDLMCPP